MLVLSLLSCGAERVAAEEATACFSRVTAVFALDPDPSHAPPTVVPDLVCACDGAVAGSLESTACATLATLQRDGVHGPADPVAAATAHRRGCDLGDGWACNGLGFALRKGLGVERDHRAAFEAYRRGCEAPIPSGKACSNAGNDLFQGRAGVQDFPAALVLFERGCGLGDQPSCSQAIVARDVPSFRSMSAQRCLDTADPGACANLAVTLPLGSADRTAALGMACDRGHPLACELLGKTPPAGPSGASPH